MAEGGLRGSVRFVAISQGVCELATKRLVLPANYQLFAKNRAANRTLQVQLSQASPQRFLRLGRVDDCCGDLRALAHRGSEA